MAIMPPDSQRDLDDYLWTGKRLAMKFEGGWSTATYRPKCSRDEGAAGDQVFHYKDKGSALLAHKLVLTEYGEGSSKGITHQREYVPTQVCAAGRRGLRI
jgi:hypothetical protein